MLKAVTVAPHRMEVVTGPRPEPGAGEALLAVEAVGLCGSDYHLFAGNHPYVRFPQTQGHEFSGRVLRLPAGYDGPLETGQRVAVEPLVACGTCYPCRRGRYNCCANLRVMGAHIPGALAEQVAVPVRSLYPVGELSAQTAALVEPLSIGLQAVHRGEIAEHDTVVVLGAGPIGLTAALAAHDGGARVLVADRVASRLETARAFGAELTVDTASADLGEAVADWTAGDGAAVVLDATGVPALIRQAFDLVAASGTIVVVGISDQEVAVPVIEFTRKEVTVCGSRNNTGLFADSVELVRRRADQVNRLISHRFPLAEVPEAIAFATAHPGEVEKVVIDIGERP